MINETCGGTIYPYCEEDLECISERCRSTCGPNAFIGSEGYCTCEENYFDNRPYGCLNPCDSDPCQGDASCYPKNASTFECVCDEGYSLDRNGTCSEMCSARNQVWLHGEIRDYAECVDGTLYCFIEDTRLAHGEILTLEVGPRICEDGLTKPLECKH